MKNHTAIHHPRSISASSAVLHSMYVRWLMLGVVAVGAIWYLVVINAIATRGAEIRRLQAELGNLKSVTAKLETQATRLQSVSQRDSASSAVELVAVDRIEYLAVRGSQAGVAVR